VVEIHVVEFLTCAAIPQRREHVGLRLLEEHDAMRLRLEVPQAFPRHGTEGADPVVNEPILGEVPGPALLETLGPGEQRVHRDHGPSRIDWGHGDPSPRHLVAANRPRRDPLDNLFAQALRLLSATQEVIDTIDVRQRVRSRSARYPNVHL
jgi:hypothetical protein